MNSISFLFLYNKGWIFIFIWCSLLILCTCSLLALTLSCAMVTTAFFCTIPHHPFHTQQLSTLNGTEFKFYLYIFAVCMCAFSLLYAYVHTVCIVQYHVMLLIILSSCLNLSVTFSGSTSSPVSKQRCHSLFPGIRVTRYCYSFRSCVEKVTRADHWKPTALMH